MKTKILAIVIAFFSMSTMSVCAKQNALITEKDKISYSIGLSMGKNFKKQGLDIDLTAIMQGIEDGLLENKPMMTEQEVQAAMNNLREQMMKKREGEQKQAATDNLKEGKDFLAKNSKRKNVVTLPSGLQYEVIKQGKGKKPGLNDVVVTNYRGELIDGTEFDSSYKRGKPATFPVKGVIPGWTEALQLMQTGAKWKLYIPANLAYGERGAGARIGPNSTLVFDIELLEIKSEQSSMAPKKQNVPKK